MSKIKNGNKDKDTAKPLVEVSDNTEVTSEEDSYFEKVLKVCGIEEKEVLSAVKKLAKSDNPTVTVKNLFGEIIITVTATATDNESAKKLGKPIVKEIKNIFGSNIYSTDMDVTLEQTVVELLKANDLCIATAESCTGGMVASRIIDVPGASEVFKEGFVTYSNKAKKTRLGVKKSTLAKYGAVSEQAAKEMAKGCMVNAKSNVSIATTGNAGPDPSEDKPVGLVYVSCCVCGKTKVNTYNFEGNRMEIRSKATAAALAMLRMCVLEYYSEKNFSL